MKRSSPYEDFDYLPEKQIIRSISQSFHENSEVSDKGEMDESNDSEVYGMVASSKPKSLPKKDNIENLTPKEDCHVLIHIRKIVYVSGEVKEAPTENLDIVMDYLKK